MPFLTSQPSKQPRYEEIRQHIQQRLSNGTWAVGSPIPGEHALAEEFSASVGTIRKAIEILVENGLLIKIQGKGTFVRQPDFSESLCRFFRHLDKQGKMRLPIGKINSISIINGDEQINTWFGHPKTAQLIYLERTRVLDEKVILSEKIWLPENRFAAIAQLKPTEFANLLYPFYMEKCACLIIKVKEQLTFLAKHNDPFLNIFDEPAIKICRWAYDMNGQIVEYRESYGRTEDFCYETEIH